MTAAPGTLREAARAQQTASNTEPPTEFAAGDNRGRARRADPPRTERYASDDQILGIASAATPPRANGTDLDSDAFSADATADSGAAANAENVAADDAAASSDAANNAEGNPQIQAALDANPELRRAWREAQSYRQSFATPEEAKAATALLGDLNRMDALFFSRRPEDHAELARAVSSLDPVAFASLVQAMNELAGGARLETAQQPGSATLGSEATNSPTSDVQRQNSLTSSARHDAQPGVPPAQIEFLHAANAAAVQGVLDAIETQVDRLLPEGVSKTARNRVVGEIYRELDGSLGTNRQLGQQMRDAFRSGNLDAAHQRAIVSLVTGRARQPLPGIAKRVLNEWTSTVVAANQDRLARQRAAAHRVDIAGSGHGADGDRRSLGPRDVDYTRMSDSDILNL
jgi:hypothetical protein